jgi:hypothetical protein
MVRAEDLAQALYSAISALGGAVEIVLALRRLAFDLRLLDLFAQGGQPPYRVFLGLSSYRQHVGSRFHLSHGDPEERHVPRREEVLRHPRA